MIACLGEGEVGHCLIDCQVVVGVNNPLHAGSAGGDGCLHLHGRIGVDGLLRLIYYYAHVAGCSLEQVIVDDGLYILGIAYHSVVAACIVAYLCLAVGVLEDVALIIEHEAVLRSGIDYLGEPTPYDEYWPSRSSYFGIFDLAGLPKDRYWLYRSHWRPKDTTIHLLPHWTWPGREGEVTPVYCYTNHPTAELFVNGKSQGVRTKTKEGDFLDRYRLRWNEVRYEPGEIRVVVYDQKGNQAGEEVVRTAGKPHHIELVADREDLKADASDMSFLTVRVVDKDGNLCPDANNQLSVKVTGTGRFKGICNGDATSLEPFTRPTMKAFHGMLSVGIITTEKVGDIHVQVSAFGLKPATLTLHSH